MVNNINAYPLSNSNFPTTVLKRKRGRPRLTPKPIEEKTVEFSKQIVLCAKKSKNINLIEGGRKSLKFKALGMKKYILDNTQYYDFTEILNFLKIYFGIDYENFILKDEYKQEFNAKVSDFFKDYTKINNKRQILIKYDYIDLFFEIICKFVNLDSSFVLVKFNDVCTYIPVVEQEMSYDYIEPTIFMSENLIKNEDAYKKKSGQYVKYKTIPKWHHYSWDMINQISNSRKSFIFSKYAEDEEVNEFNKKRLDLDTIILQLKLKIYNNIFEFIDDLFKMVKYSIDNMQRINSKTN